MPSPFRSKVCAECGRTWETRKQSSRTCSPPCRARLREREKPSKGAPPRDYPAEIVRLVRGMYATGATIREIGDAIGPGYRAQTLIDRYVPERRPAIKRDQIGERNDSWKGDAAGYAALHLRVQAARGKPANCERCGLDDPAARYEWANLTGRYEDVNDYQRMCISCHRSYDAARRAATGRCTSPLRRRQEVMSHV